MDPIVPFFHADEALQQPLRVLRAALQGMQGRSVVVASHVRPDGDSVGSQVALCRVLRRCQVEAVVVFCEPLPPGLQALVGDTPQLDLRQPWPPTAVPLAQCLLVTVDCATLGRTGPLLLSLLDPLGSLQGAFLSIDHHPADNDPATYVIRDTRAVATAELLARLFGADPQLAACLDATTAQALYAGIYTDTGQLLFDSVTAPLFDLLAGLVRAGAVPGQVGRTLYSTHPWSRLCLMQRFLASLRRECHGTVCIGSLTPEDYQATGAAPQDCEGFVDMARSIQGVELGVLLDYGQSPSSKGSTVRASMRARSPQWRLDALAAHWGGGGHPAAAGFTSQATDLGGFYPVFLQQLQAHVARVTASGADDTFAPTPS